MTDSMVFKLWPNDETRSTEKEFSNAGVDNLRFLYSVNVPTLTTYLPDPMINTGTAMIVCPGGGLFTHAIDYEGHDVAKWLCERGIAAFVLKYRVIETGLEGKAFEDFFGTILDDVPHLVELGHQHRPTMVADGQQAIKLVREHAGEWDIDSQHVGMMGFSAGAFVTVVTTLDSEQESRPNFAASIYGALWDKIDGKQALPPMFIALADDDSLTVQPSLDLYAVWHQTQSPVELHIYAHGGHGFGMRKIHPTTGAWIQRMYEWMQGEGLVKANKEST